MSYSVIDGLVITLLSVHVHLMVAVVQYHFQLYNFHFAEQTVSQLDTCITMHHIWMENMKLLVRPTWLRISRNRLLYLYSGHVIGYIQARCWDRRNFVTAFISSQCDDDESVRTTCNKTQLDAIWHVTKPDHNPSTSPPHGGTTPSPRGRGIALSNQTVGNNCWVGLMNPLSTPNRNAVWTPHNICTRDYNDMH